VGRDGGRVDDLGSRGPGGRGGSVGGGGAVAAADRAWDGV